jgi:AraC-like DNA-binding protein
MNHGAYTNPFSGVGMEFYPLGVRPDLSNIVLHSTDYLPHNNSWNFPNVLSPFWRLFYFFKPGHQVEFKHGTYPLTPEHIMLIPDHELFHCRGANDVPSLTLHFSVSRRLALQVAVPVLLKPTPAELELIRATTGYFHGGMGKGDRTQVFHHSLALLNIVLCRPELVWLDHSVRENILKVRQHIERSPSLPLTIPELARMAGLSVSGFAKAFKQQQGVSANRFINQIRVREAARLLATTHDTLEDIAENTGFCNRDYLSRVFKAVTGEAPAAFRRQHGIEALTP